MVSSPFWTASPSSSMCRASSSPADGVARAHEGRVEGHEHERLAPGGLHQPVHDLELGPVEVEPVPRHPLPVGGRPDLRPRRKGLLVLDLDEVHARGPEVVEVLLHRGRPETRLLAEVHEEGGGNVARAPDRPYGGSGGRRACSASPLQRRPRRPPRRPGPGMPRSCGVSRDRSRPYPPIDFDPSAQGPVRLGAHPTLSFGSPGGGRRRPGPAAGLSALCAENRRAMLRARMPAPSPRTRPHG